MSPRTAGSAKKSLDRNVWEWYCESCSKNGKKVSKSSLQARAKWVFHDAGILDFKASDGWYRRFIQRWRDSEPNSEPNSKSFDGTKTETNPSNRTELARDLSEATSKTPNEASNTKQTSSTSINEQQPKDIETSGSPTEDEYAGEIIDCLSKFIDTSELSQTSMDFFYDSEDSSFSTTRNALLLAETEHQSEGPKARHRKRGERYLPRFKEKVLAFVARHHSIKKAAAKFKIHETTISHWRRDQSKQGSAATETNTKETLSPDEQLVTWLRRCRERGVVFTSAQLAGKAGTLAAEPAAPKWLAAWAARLAETKTYAEGVLVPRESSERNVRYPDAFKAEVAAFAEAGSQTAAAALFAVSRRRVFDWLQARRRSQRWAAALSATGEQDSTPDAHKELEVSAGPAQPDDETPTVGEEPRVPGAGLQGQGAAAPQTRGRLPSADVDEAIWSWFQAQTPRPTAKQVRVRGAELYKEHGLAVKCSHGWHQRWCQRHSVKLRFDTDDRLLQWTLTQLEANKSVSHHDLQVHAMRLLSVRKPGFKASAGWALRFCRRHPALLHSAPALDTPLPAHLAARVARFRSNVQNLVSSGGLPFSAVGNVDELYLNFGGGAEGAEGAEGAGGGRKPLLRRSEMADCHATVVLACLADGTLLPPTVILKGSADSDWTAPAGATLHSSAALDEPGMLRWLRETWAAATNGAPSLLLADCFPAHSAPAVRSAANAAQTRLLVMPGGCASKLQPLGVAVKAFVKTHVERRWHDHNAAMQSPWLPGPKAKLPAPAQIVCWVGEACASARSTQQETIRRSFLVTGLTVAANHSEDHFIDNPSMIPAFEES